MIEVWVFTNGNAEQVFTPLYEAYQLNGEIDGGLVFDISEDPEMIASAEDMLVTTYPCYVFMHVQGDLATSITRINGLATAAQINEVTNYIHANWSEVENGGALNANGDIFGAIDGSGSWSENTEPGGNQPGDGGGDDSYGNGYGLDLPNWFWWGATAFCTYKSAEAGSNAGMAVWGTAATAAGIKAFNQ